MLYWSAGGTCEICGQPLGEEWEADHVIPWSVSGRTNAFEMQALCVSCNRRKGTTMLRKPQAEFARLLGDIRDHKLGVTKIIAHVTPGGGKSLFTSITAHEMVKTGWAHGVCTVVPRDTLRRQAAADATKAPAADLFGRLEIREVTNQAHPLRAAQGFVTTYQAIAANPTFYHALFDAFRIILIGDEPHHLVYGDVWHRAFDGLAMRTPLLVLMSGTLQRGDHKRIAYLDYEPSPDGGDAAVLRSDERTACIRYSRRDALDDKHILPIEITLVDGHGEWVDRDGDRQTIESFDDSFGMERDALYSALSTEFAYDLLRRAYDNWCIWRVKHARSKMLVVAATIKSAELLKTRLRTWGEVGAEIATSDDPGEAIRQIGRFKRTDGDHIDCLVTVAMAYEGLDVPQISHLACLTHIRSIPWIDQMMQRAGRVDSAVPLQRQAARVWAPDDQLMREVVKQIREDQQGIIYDRLIDDEPDIRHFDRADGRQAASHISPTDGAATYDRILDNFGEAELSREEIVAITAAMDDLGIDGQSVKQMKKFLERFDRQVNPQPIPRGAYHGASNQQREASLRTDIQAYCNAYDRAYNLPKGTANIKVKGQFRKSREDMSVPELETVWRWIERNLRLPEAHAG